MKFTVVLLCLFGAALAYPNKERSDPRFIAELHSGVDDLSSVSDLRFKASPEWSYSGPDGPDNWYTSFPTCGGTNQSPIAIDSTASVPTFNNLFTFNDFNTQPPSASVSNNGHTATVSLAGKPATVTGGDLPAGDFTFMNLHYHWGSVSSQGSEHTVDEVQYPLEQHMVFWNTKYSTSEEAIQNPDGLAVLSTLYEVSDVDNPFLEPIVTALSSITQPETATTVHSPSFTLGDLLPALTDDYFRYFGSLTTPSCNEVVTWTVFTTRLSISEKQLGEFRLLLDHALEPLVDNFRPVQPLNSRVVNMND